MSQQAALLSIYHGLARGEALAARQRLHERLNGGPAFFSQELRWADANLFDAQYEILTADRQALIDHPGQAVLAIQKLELLIAMSSRFLKEDGLQLMDLLEEGRSDTFRPLLESLAEGDGPQRRANAEGLARAIDTVVRMTEEDDGAVGGRFEPLQTSGGHSVVPSPDRPLVADLADDGRNLVAVSFLRDASRQHVAEPPTANLRVEDVESAESAGTNETDLVLMLARAEGVHVADELQAQPSISCVGWIQKFDTGEQGEFAAILRTDTVFRKDVFPNLELRMFWKTLLDPTTWDEAHPFWCSMQLISEETHSAADLGVEPADLIGECLKAPDDDGDVESPKLIWEKVGICDEPPRADLFPWTFLCFKRSHSHKSQYWHADELRLEYNLIPTDQSFLDLDDGYVIVADDQDSEQIRVRVMKSLHLRGFDGQTEAQALAMYACEAGWADQTRHLILKTLNL